MDVLDLKSFEKLSPFEIKDELIELAKETSKRTQSAFLNAGRGNPNWIATTPREGFFLLGQFAITESKRVMEDPAGLGGMPKAQGIARRFEAWLRNHSDMPGASFLSEVVPFAVKTFGFEPDSFVHELVDSIIGDNYPVPDRMLVHNERITHEYLMWAMCGDPKPAGKFDLYAVEGGTAAMCYIFKSLKANRLLHPGDTIALGTPIFTPYIEMTSLEDYDLKVVHIQARQENRFQFTDDEIVERTLYGLINEGARVLEEGFALRASDIDVIYVNGYGFPAWRGGPMFYADSIGLKRIVERIAGFEREFGARWNVSSLLQRLAESDTTFRSFDEARETKGEQA